MFLVHVFLEERSSKDDMDTIQDQLYCKTNMSQQDQVIEESVINSASFLYVHMLIEV